jgi:hypothetical protein
MVKRVFIANPPIGGRSCLDRKFFSTHLPASFDDGCAGSGAHALKESMATFSAALFWLVCAFHDIELFNGLIYIPVYQ